MPSPISPPAVAVATHQNQTVYYEQKQPEYAVIHMMPNVPTMICPFCGYTVSPIVSYEPSLLAWIMCIFVSILFMPFFFVGFLIGYFILTSDACQQPRYICPLCGNVFITGF